MTLRINVTYETWNEEALEVGETNDRGFEEENLPVTLTELVAMLRGCEPSQYKISSEQVTQWTWATAPDDEDFVTGERTVRSYHLANPKNKRAYRMWQRAFKLAGLAS